MKLKETTFPQITLDCYKSSPIKCIEHTAFDTDTGLRILKTIEQYPVPLFEGVGKLLHISTSRMNGVPTKEEIAEIKKIFFKDIKVVTRTSEYTNKIVIHLLQMPDKHHDSLFSAGYTEYKGEIK